MHAVGRRPHQCELRETLVKIYLLNYRGDTDSGEVNNQGIVKTINTSRQSATKHLEKEDESSTTIPRREYIQVNGSALAYYVNNMKI